MALWISRPKKYWLELTFTERKTAREFYNTQSGKSDGREHLYFPLDLQKGVMLLPTIYIAFEW